MYGENEETWYSTEYGISELINRVLFEEGKIMDIEYRRMCLRTLKEIFYSPLHRVIKRVGDTYRIREDSVIFKQWKKSDLGLDMMQELFERHFLQNMEILHNSMKKFVEENENKTENVFKRHLFYVDLSYKRLWNWLHDAYTLARMFKPYTSCVMFYGGTSHVLHMQEYLFEMGAMEIMKVEADNSCLHLTGGKKGVRATELRFGHRINSLRRVYNLSK